MRKHKIPFGDIGMYGADISNEMNTLNSTWRSEYGLEKDSVVLLEQIRTIDKTRLKEKIGELNSIKMNQVNKAMMISLGVI